MKSKRTIYYLLLLLPIIDLITSIQTRLMPDSFTVGSLIKGLLVIVSVVYLLFKSSSKYKKWSIIYLICIALYTILYFAFKPDIFNFTYLFSEINYLIRIVFLPIIFITLLNYFDEFGFNKRLFSKTMAIVLLEYTLFLLIPILFNTGFDTYSTGLNGKIGWFFSANEISAIMICLLPFMYYFINNNQKYGFVISLPILYTLTFIGTKVTLLGTFIVTIGAFITIFIIDKGKISRRVINSLIVVVLNVLFFALINATAIQNISLSPKEDNYIILTIDDESFFAEILSDRDDYYSITKKTYTKSYDMSYPLFGMGFSNTPRVNNVFGEQLIEMDYLDLFFHAGIVGLFINLVPLLYSFILIVKYLYKNKIILSNGCFIFYNSLIIVMLLGVAAIAGHVLFYPAVSIYLSLYLIFIINATYIFEKKPIDNKKISFLALHLKYGGIETVITNQANMLAENYDVEIISLYNNHSDIPYKLNKNIKVTYLMNTISNREEFKEALNIKNIFRILREGFKALKIIILKPLLIKRTILNSDAKVIISSRAEFSKILGKYHRDGVLTISEEHVYHNNDPKYINKVIYANKKNDYLLPTSKELCDFYKGKVKAKVEYIPNSIDYIPQKSNALNSKKILAIGRLAKEKGFIDLIEVMKETLKKDNKVTLDIYGDGTEKDALLKAIHDNNLDNNITLKGFVSPDKLKELRDDYDLIICSSYEESFGLAVLETMAYGIPCITFDDPKGILEFVNDEDGIIIKNRNIKKMASSIVDLLKDKKRLKQLGEKAREKASEYDFNKIKLLFNKFINDAIDRFNGKQKNVMFISSAGGHFNELKQLDYLMDRYNSIIVTEKSKSQNNKEYKYLPEGTRFHPLKYFLWVLPGICIKSLYYYLKYKPEYIITTGVHTAGPMCCIGKIFGSKIIYIESFANVYSKTATGRIIYNFADLFIVQWEDMKKIYPESVYGGWIFK